MMLGAQVLYSTESANLVQFGGKMLDQGFAYGLVKFRDQMTKLGVAEHLFS